MSVEDKVRLLRESFARSKEEATRDELGNVHRFYSFRPWDSSEGQKAFMASDADTQAFAAANRTGKSFCGDRKCAAYALGADPLFPEKRFINPKDRPFAMWLGVPAKFTRDALASFLRWIPKDRILGRPHWQLGYEMVELRPTEDRPYGSVVKIKSYGLPLEEWQRELVDVVRLDERPPSYAWPEIQQRLIMSKDPSIGWKGKLILTATLVEGHTWLFPKCRDFAASYRNLLTGPFAWFSVSQFENPELTEEDIARGAEGLSEDMYKIRVLGVPLRLEGTEIFPQALCDALAKGTREPELNLRFTGDGRAEWGSWHRQAAGWAVWEKPVPGAKYALGADPSQGVGADFASAHIGRKDTGAVVATFHNNYIDPVAFGEELALAGLLYNKAMIVPETNIASVLHALRTGAYPNIYQRRAFGGKMKVEQEALGWYTDGRSKEPLIRDLKTALDRGMKGGMGGIALYCAETLSELSAFGYLRARRPGSHGMGNLDDSRNDDRVISLALMVQGLAQQAPAHVGRHTKKRFSTWWDKTTGRDKALRQASRRGLELSELYQDQYDSGS